MYKRLVKRLLILMLMFIPVVTTVTEITYAAPTNTSSPTTNNNTGSTSNNNGSNNTNNQGNGNSGSNNNSNNNNGGSSNNEANKPNDESNNKPSETNGNSGNLNKATSFIKETINAFFVMIIKAIANALGNLSKILLAITVLLAALDMIFTIMQAAGGLNIVQIITSSIPKYITYGIVMLLLKVDKNNISLYTKLTIGNPDTIFALDKSQQTKSIMVGFLKMSEKFYELGQNSSTQFKIDFSNIGDMLVSLITIPFTMLANAFQGGSVVGVMAGIIFLGVAFSMLFLMLSLIMNIITAIIEYMFVVGLSQVYLPFLVNSTTASIGSKVITNIISKGVGLTIQLGLVGISVKIILESMLAPPQDIVSAVEALTVIGLCSFVASKGAEIARGILTGEGGGLKASELVNRSITKALKTAVITATGVGLAAKGLSAIKNKAQGKESKAGQAKREAKEAGDNLKKAQKENADAKSNLINMGASSKDIDMYGDLTDKIHEGKSEQADLKAQMDKAKDTYGEDSVQYKNASMTYDKKTEQIDALNEQRNNLVNNMKTTLGDKATGIDDKLKAYTNSNETVKYREQEQNKTVQRYVDIKEAERQSSAASKINNFAQSTGVLIAGAFGGDTKSFRNDLEQMNRAREQSSRSLSKEEASSGSNRIYTATKRATKGVILGAIRNAVFNGTGV